MDGVLNWLWQGGVVALALLLMLRLLERARANVRYVVCWGALLLVGALPWLPTLSADLPRHEPLAAGPAVAIVTVPDAWWTSVLIVAAAWALWACVGAMRFAMAIAALRRAKAGSSPFPRELESILPHWRRICASGRRADLRLSESVTTAAVLGGMRPVIAVAPSLLTSLGPDELDRIVVHEWAHVQRRDDLLNLLQVALRIVVGWHPAVWWIDRRLHLEREIACDETTLSITGAPKSYASCLLKLATIRGAETTSLAAPAALRASGLRARVTRIVSGRAFIAPLFSRGIGAGIVSGLCAVTLVVGELRLVGERVLALPFDAIPAIAARVHGVSHAPSGVVLPVAPPVAPAPAAPAQAQIVSPPLDVEPELTAQLPSTAPVVAVTREPSISVDPVEQPVAAPPLVADVVEASPTPLVQEVPAAAAEGDGEDRSPWAVMADQGTALGRKSAEQGTSLGRKSKDAGTATAGFFTRFARRVAGSF